MGNVRYAKYRQTTTPKMEQVFKSGYNTGMLIAMYSFANFYEEITPDDVQEFMNACDKLCIFAEKHTNSWKDIKKFLENYTGMSVTYQS